MTTNHIFKQKLRSLALPFFAMGLFATNLVLQPACAMDTEETKQYFSQIKIYLNEEKKTEAKQLYKIARKKEREQALSILLPSAQLPQIEILKRLSIIPLLQVKMDLKELSCHLEEKKDQLQKEDFEKASNNLVRLNKSLSHVLYTCGLDYYYGPIQKYNFLFMYDQPTPESFKQMKQGDLALFSQDNNLYCKVYNKETLHIPIDNEIKKGVDWNVFDYTMKFFGKEIPNLYDDSREKILQFTTLCGYTEGVPKNEWKAKNILKVAIELKNSEAMVELSKMYDQFEDESAQDIRSHDLHKEAAELNNTEGTYLLGVDYIMGRGVAKDFEKGKELLENVKNAKAAIFMYDVYEQGKYGIEKNFLTALKFLEKAYDLKDPQARQKLIHFYRDGLAGKKDIENYIRLLREGSMLKDEVCMLELAAILIKGKDVKQDFDEALELLNKIETDILYSFTGYSEDYVNSSSIKCLDRVLTSVDAKATKDKFISLINEKKKEEKNNK